MIALLSIALTVVYCFTAWRWTRRLSVLTRWLIRSLALALLYPVYINYKEEVLIAPSIFLLTFDFRDLNFNNVEKILIQISAMWVITFGLWAAITRLISPRAFDSKNARHLKFMAVLFSLPLWTLITGITIYHIWINDSLRLDLLNLRLVAIIFLISIVCSLASMTMFLCSWDETVLRLDIFWTAWAVFPIFLAAFYGCLLWHWAVEHPSYRWYAY